MVQRARQWRKAVDGAATAAMERMSCGTNDGGEAEARGDLWGKDWEVGGGRRLSALAAQD